MPRCTWRGRARPADPGDWRGQAKSWQRDKAGGESQGGSAADPEMQAAADARAPTRRRAHPGPAWHTPVRGPGDKDADSRRGLLPELVSVGPERAWRVSLGLPRPRGGLKLIGIPVVSTTPGAPDKGLGERGSALSQGWSRALVELLSPPWGPRATVYLTWRPLEGRHPPPKEHSGFPILDS